MSGNERSLGTLGGEGLQGLTDGGHGTASDRGVARLGVLLLGLLIPAVMDFWILKNHANRLLVLASTVCVLLGALTLRWVIVIGGQM